MTKKAFTKNEVRLAMAASRKALMRADPDYFLWSEEQKEAFRGRMTQEMRESAHQLIWSEIVKQPYEPYSTHVTDEQSKLVDLSKAYLSGIGRHHLRVLDSVSERSNPIDLSTVYALDQEEYRSINSHKWTYRQNPLSADYLPLRQPLSIEYLEGQMMHATLFSLPVFVLSFAHAEGERQIEKRVPHQVIEGERYGERVGDGVILDLKVDANGKEALLNALNSELNAYLDGRLAILCEQQSEERPMALVRQDDDSGQVSFIFNNAEALKKVRWRHFLEDVAQLKAHHHILFQFMEQEIRLVGEFISEEFNRQRTALLIKGSSNQEDQFRP